MSDTDNKPTLGRKPLGLKRSVEAGEVKQTFSHGRTNKVVVEVKRRKLIGKPGMPEAAPPPPPPAGAGAAQARAASGHRRADGRDAPGTPAAPAARGRRGAHGRARGGQ